MSELIAAVCPNCQKRYQVKPSFIGKNVCCKACQNSFQVVAAETPKPLEPAPQFVPTQVVPANPATQVVPVTPFAAEVQPTATQQGPLEVRGNPKMPLAMIGSILVSIAIIALCHVLGVVSASSATASTGTEKGRSNKTGPAAASSIVEAPRPVFSVALLESMREARANPKPLNEQCDGLSFYVPLNVHKRSESPGEAVSVLTSGDFAFLTTQWSVLTFDLSTKKEVAAQFDFNGLGEISSSSLGKDGDKLCVGGKNGAVAVFDVGEDGVLTQSALTFSGNGSVVQMQVSP